MSIVRRVFGGEEAEGGGEGAGDTHAILNIPISSQLQEVFIFPSPSIRGRPAMVRPLVRPRVGMLRTYLLGRLIVVLLHFLGSATLAAHNCTQEKHVNTLEMIIKVASVIGMTFLYDAGYSVVLLRSKNEVKPLTQSAESGFVRENGLYQV